MKRAPSCLLWLDALSRRPADFAGHPSGQARSLPLLMLLLKLVGALTPSFVVGSHGEAAVAGRP